MPPTPSKRRRSTSPMPTKKGSSSSVKKSTTPNNNRHSSTKTSSKSLHGNNRDWKKYKQQQDHDYNTHQFLDASATVNAGLFGARRLPEIKKLWRHMVQGELNTLNECKRDRQTHITDAAAAAADGKHHEHDVVDQRAVIIRRAGESGGGKISSRHLRRRTNSHKRRRRHRFPRGKDELGGVDTGMREGVESGVVGVTSEKEKSDDDALGNNSETSAKKSSGGRKKQKPCRRARRKPALMKISHSNWWEAQTKHVQSNQNPASIQANESKAPHNWIPTHMWHAKRFQVSPPLFSWSIPLIHSNRGSRAALRLASSESSPKCTIQDGTWEVNGCAIKLEVTKFDAEQKPMETLLFILRRLCGADAPFLNDESVLAGRRLGEGLVHEIDAYPLQSIGPATFMFGCPSNDDVSGHAHASILVHPSIHQRVVSLLTSIMPSDVDTNLKVGLSTAPLALLRIRGRASMSTLLEVLEQAENIGLLDDDVDHCSLIELGTPPSLAVLPNNGTKSIPNAITSPSSILVKSHQPNQSYQHLPHNVACSGWDIICHPSIGSMLFQSFANNGGACAIGLVEDARALLEAYPPLPVFPRDYPDTEEGKAYWEGGKSDALLKKKDVTQSNATWKDWAVIRTCLEESWGRINTPLKRTIRHWKQDDGLAKKKAKTQVNSTSLDESPAHKLITKGEILGRDATSIRWESLISTDAESTIVVRGSFGIPFLQLLHGCGKLSHSPSGSISSENSRRRRPRRTVRPPGASVHASPLSKKDSEAHSGLCQQLRASLSLPALLRCELFCEGKGALNAGDLILSLASQDDDDDISEDSDLEDGSGTADEKSHALPLGIVVAGGFSPSRGKSHGVGFVGADKLIDTLDGTDHGMGIMLPQSNGPKMMTLKVMVVRNSSSTGCRRYALLSILL